MSQEERGNVMQEVFSIGGGNPFEGSLLVEEPKEIEKPKEPTIENITGTKQEEKQSSPAEPPSQKESGEKSIAKGSAAYILAQSMIKEGTLPEDIELSPNMTASELKSKLIEVSKREALDDVRSEYEQKYDPELLKTADYINKGIDPEDIKEVNIYKKLANVEVPDDYEQGLEVKEFVIKQMYKDLGFSDTKIQKLVSGEIDEDEGESAFKEAIKHFKNKAIALEKSIQDEAEERQAQMAKEQENVNEKLKTLIKSGEIYNTSDEKSQKELEDFLFKQTETITQDGKKFKVTGFYKKMMDYQTDLKSQLIFARLLKDGFDLKSVEQKGALKKVDEIDNLLSQAVSGTTSTKNKVNEDDFFSSLKEL